MPSIRHELLISAPIQKVRDAIMTQQGLSKWWTPNTQIFPERNMIRLPFGPDYFKEMEIVKQDPHHIEWRCLAGVGEWIGTTLSFKFDAGYKEDLVDYNPEIAGQMEQQTGETVTLLIFRHDYWLAETPMLAECNYTWAMFLRSLKLYCETGHGQPFPHQHQ